MFNTKMGRQHLHTIIVSFVFVKFSFYFKITQLDFELLYYVQY